MFSIIMCKRLSAVKIGKDVKAKSYPNFLIYNVMLFCDNSGQGLSEGSISSPSLSSSWRQLTAIISLQKKILTYGSASAMEGDSG